MFQSNKSDKIKYKEVDQKTQQNKALVINLHESFLAEKEDQPMNGG